MITACQLHEQYRPRVWAEVIGQDKVLARIDALRRRGLGGRSYWIAGASGTGKTTIAKLLAAEIADDFGIEELDAKDCTPVLLKSIERSMHMRPLGGRGRAVIVNEAHGLCAPAIRQLLVMLERLPSHVAWIFTTTRAGQEALFDDCIDAHPLLSRCTVLSLTTQGLAKAFAARAKAIAQAEGLDGRPIEAYVRLVQDHHNNFRAVLQEIEAGRMLEG